MTDAELIRRYRALGIDEQEVVAEVLRGLEVGNVAYGELDINSDPRDFGEELFAEVRDGLIYGAIAMIQRRRERRG